MRRLTQSTEAIATRQAGGACTFAHASAVGANINDVILATTAQSIRTARRESRSRLLDRRADSVRGGHRPGGGGEDVRGVEGEGVAGNEVTNRVHYEKFSCPPKAASCPLTARD